LFPCNIWDNILHKIKTFNKPFELEILLLEVLLAEKFDVMTVGSKQVEPESWNPYFINAFYALTKIV